MLKVAFLAAALAAATTAQAVNVDSTAGTMPIEAPSCHAAPAQDLDCPVHPPDAGATPSTADLPGFAAPAVPTADWTALHPPRGSGLDFKDAATEPASMLAAMPDTDGQHRLLPALFALGGLVLLLRKRPL